jgi:hypothetical protein
METLTRPVEAPTRAISRSTFIALVAVVALIGSSAWTWHTLLRGPGIHRPLQEAIGQTLARETVALTSQRTDVVLLPLAAGESAILDAQVEAFRLAWAKQRPRASLEISRIDPEGKSKYRPGSGLSAARMLRTAKKNEKAAAIVSFIGLPEMDETELKALGDFGPKWLAFCRNTKKISRLLASSRVHAVVVPRFQFPAPVEGTPATPQEWFDLQFQLLAQSSSAKER